MSLREIWITGMGIISAVGEGLDAHLNAIYKQKSGISSQMIFGGAIPDPCLVGKIPETVLNVSIDDSAANRANILADRSTRQALDQAQIISPNNADLIIGTTLGNMHGGTTYYKALKSGEDPSVDTLKYVMPDAIGSFLSQKYGVNGKRLTVSSACASGMTAIATAANRIRNNHCDVAIANGVDALSPFVVAGFNSLRLLSKKECKPFDASRDGLNPGEASACLILESANSARKKIARPLAKLSGCGCALEAFHYTKSHPEGKGIAVAICKALSEAQLRPDQIDHIHAHGTATVFNDLSEYNGFCAVFGDRLAEIPVCSTKSMTGHTFGAAGAIAAVMSVLSINNSVIPSTLYHVNKDPLFNKLYIPAAPVSKPIKRVLSVALGFGGEAAAMIVEAA